MKNYFSLSLSLILFVVILSSSCTMKKDAKEIILNSFDERQKIKSCEFTYLETEWVGGRAELTALKIYAQRIPNNKIFPFKFRVEQDNGDIKSFDGKVFKWSVKKSETGYFYEDIGMIQKQIRHITELIRRILPTENKKESMKFLDDKNNLAYMGKADVYGVNCDILNFDSKANEGTINIYTSLYKGVEDGFTRKVNYIVYVNKLKYVEQNLAIKDIKINQKYNDTLFSASIPKDYNIKYIRPEPAPTQDVQNQKEDVKLLEKGAEAPNWTLIDGNGKNVSLSDLKGKVVLLDFWGTWCVWCIAAMPKIQNVYEEFKKQNVVIYGISCREPENADPVSFARQKGIGYDVLLKGDEIAKLYNVTGFPTLYIIDKEGRVIQSEAGYYPELDKKLIELIKKHL
jgi:peroxiredoxin